MYRHCPGNAHWRAAHRAGLKLGGRWRVTPSRTSCSPTASRPRAACPRAPQGATSRRSAAVFRVPHAHQRAGPARAARRPPDLDGRAGGRCAPCLAAPVGARSGKTLSLNAATVLAVRREWRAQFVHSAHWRLSAWAWRHPHHRLRTRWMRFGRRRLRKANRSPVRAGVGSSYFALRAIRR
jgi:hypothetical protein